MTKILVDKVVLEQALEALEYYRSGEDYQPTPASKSITVLRTTLTEQVQESVRLPTSAAEAELMAKVGLMWLEQNTPDRLLKPVQEPVFEVGLGWLDDATKYPKGTKLYTAPIPT